MLLIKQIYAVVSDNKDYMTKGIITFVGAGMSILEQVETIIGIASGIVALTVGIMTIIKLKKDLQAKQKSQSNK